MVSFLYLLLALLTITENGNCSHFRGGIIMVRPRPGGGASEMEIFWHISWRRDSGAGGSCTSSTVQSGQLIGGGALSCTSGCSGTVANLDYKCTDFSLSENWSFGENKAYYTFPSSGTMQIRFASCCWVSPFSSSWGLSTTFSMTTRSDTNTINSTPRAATSPVVRLQAGCSHKIQIPVSDPDDDVVKCRFATGTDCTGICNGVPGATIDSTTCTISYTAPQSAGYKAIALSIEDFAPGALSTPLSKVNLQFLVYIFTSTESCSASPYFVSPPTLKQGVCVAVDVGSTFTTQITANSNSSTKSISEISTISPSGSSKSAVTHISNTNNYYVTITWTPTVAQQGQTHVVCYTAISSSGSTSTQTCIKVDAGILPPAPNTTTLSPKTNGKVSASNTVWSLQFTQSIQRPSVSSFIKFHNAATDLVVYKLDAASSTLVSFVGSNGLQISPSYTFTEDQSYYITFEGGIVNSLEGCEPGNDAVTDKTFWTFQTPTSTVPANTVVQASSDPYYYSFSAMITCFATGLPIPTVNWYKDGVLLSTGNNDITIQTTNDTSNQTQSILTISSLMINHEGTYSCNGTNILSNGSTVSDVATFTIASSGIIVVNFTGIAISSTAIYLSWDVHSVFGIVVNYFVVECDELETQREWSFFAVETHANVISLHPYYSYSCRVRVVGNETYPFNTPIVVYTDQAAPSGAPQNPTHSFYSSSTLNLTWYPPPIDKQNGIILYYIIQMIEVETSIGFQFTSNFTYINLTSLHPYYSYTFIISAVTIASGPFSTQYTVLMPEDAPTAPPLNISAVVDNSKTVTLNWLPPVFEHRNGIIRKYEISVIGNDNVEYIETVQNTSITISYLHPNYMYKVTIRAITIEKGVKSLEITFETPEDAPSKAPTMFNATATSPYTAVLTWEPLPEDGQNGVIIGYVIQVIILETNETVYLFSNYTYLVVNTLRPYRTYVCIIAARTAIGTGPYGPQFVLVSPQDAPSGPPSLSSSSQSLVITSTSFYLEWGPPSFEEQNGVIQYYTITVTEVETGIIYQYTRYSTSITVSSLHPAYTYQFVIAAYTVGLGPYSESFSITLEEEAPSGSPNQFSGLSSSSSSISLSWDPPSADQQNGVITLYFISLTLLDTGETYNYTTNDTQFTVPDLVPFSTYSCIIAAQTIIGRGPFTLSITIVTLEDAPNVSPTITIGYSIDSSTVAIQWTPPPPEDHNGIIREYRVFVINLKTGENQTRVFASTTGIIGSLIPSFEYMFSVTAFTVAEGPYSTSINISLPEDVPSGYPQSIAGNSTSPTGIYLSWSPPADEEQNGNILQYVINVTHADTLETTQYYTTNTFIYITGLDPYTTYVCVVAAETSIGIGPFSNLYFIQTDEDAPDSAPLHASGIAIGPSSIHITWDPPSVEDHNGVIREYRVNVTQITTQYFNQLVTNQTQIIIEDLKPYHIYHCYVSALTVDEGPFTTAITVLTQEDAPSSSPQTLAVTVVDSTSVSMMWSAPPTPDHNGIIRSYSIKVTSTDDIHTEQFLFSTQSTNFNTSVLKPYTAYSIQVAAVTVSEGPFTPLYNITTMQDVPSSSPQEVNASTSSPTTVHLSWLPPPLADINGVIQYYNLSFTEIETGSSSWKIVITTSSTVSNLHPFYTYQFSVTAVTVGEGPSIITIIQMPESAPSSAPSSLTAINLTSSTVYLSWDGIPAHDQNGIIRHYRVNITETDTGADLSTIAYSNLLTVNDLHPYYTYHVSVAAHTINTGPYSTDISFQMNEDVPTSSPTGLSVSVLNSTYVQISWNAPPISEQNGVIIKYNLSVTLVETEEVLGLITSSNTVIFGGLSPYTIYHCTVSAYTSVGSGPFTSLVYFETDEAAPAASPEEVTITDVSSTDIEISWEEPVEDLINGIIRRYDIKVYEMETNTTTIKDTVTDQITLTSLHPYYHYEISVAAVTVERGPYSSPISVTTDEAAPIAAPTLITINGIKSTSFNVSWSLPPADQINGVIQHYSIKVQVSDTLETVYYESSTTSLMLTDLHPYYTYTVFVAAVTVATGPFSAGNSVQTDADIPTGPPLNVTGSVISSSKIGVSWDPPSAPLQNGPVLSYTITVFELDTNTTTQEHKDFLHNTIILINLHPNYEYLISVSAYTVGLGPSSNIQLSTLEDVPSGPPNNIEVTVTSSTTITIQWTEPNLEAQNGVIQHYRITLVAPDNTQQIATTSDLSIQLNNLHPFYSYSCSVQAVTIGNGPNDTVTFTTLEDVPASAPSSLATSSITSTGVMLSWSPLSLSDHNGILLGYVIKLSESDTENQWTLLSNTTSLSVLAILSPHTSYEFAVAARTVIGPGPYSSNVSFTTREDSPVSSPRNVNVSMVTSTSFLLSWIPPVEDDINGVVTGYIVSVAVQETQETFTINTTSTSLSLTQLHPYYTHRCSVTCVTITNGPYSDPIDVQTLQDAPSSTVQAFTVATPFSHTLQVTWTPPPSSDINGIIKYYSVHISVAEILESTEYKTDKTFFIITDAHPHYTYSVKVSAITVAYGPYTPVTTVTTPQDVPTGSPLNLTSTVINSTATYVSWQPPVSSHQNGVIKYYTVTVSEEISDILVNSYTVSEHDVIITDLHPYYSYEVEVSAFTIGAGPIIAATFTTDEDVPSSGPLNVSISNLTSSSVLIQWSPPLSHHQNGIIRYYTVTILEIPTNIIATINTTNLYIEVDNLHPYYDYVHEVTAVTIGSGPPTIGTFKLLEDIPSSSPQNVSIVPVNATALYVSWSPPEEHYHNGIIRSYSLIITDLADNSYTKFDINGSLTSTLITDLNPFHTYGVRVAAYTIGVGPYSDIVNDTLPQSEPSKSPTEFVAILQQDLSVHFSWISPPSDDINGVLLGYTIACTALNEHEVSVNVSGTTASVSPLQSETHYTCTVCAYTIIGCGPRGITHISTYEGSPIGPPESVTASSVSNTMIGLHWTPPFDPNDEVIGYGIIYQLIDTSFPLETPRPPVTLASESTDLKYIIGSLLANSVYKVSVFAVFDEGTGPVSDEITVTTIIEDSNAVRNYQCLSVSSESLSCSWEFPESPDGYYISECQLSYQLADGWDYFSGYGTILNRISLSPVTTDYVINGLHTYAGYIVELKYVLSHDVGSGDYAMPEDEIDNITSISSLFNTTLLEVPEASVEDFSVTVTSPSSVEISWKPPSRVEWNGPIDSYGIISERASARTDSRKKRETEIILVTPQANHGDPSLASEPLTKEIFTLEDLEENFEYHFSMVIINSKGGGLPNPPVMQTMPESAPSGPPINITAVDVTKSSLTIQWKPPNPLDANGIIIQYSLNLTRIAIRDSSVRLFSKDQLSYKQQGLQVYENVSVSIAAQTAVGWGPFSQLYYFNTLEDLPGSPVDLKKAIVNGNSVVLSWSPPNSPNGVIIGYQLVYSGHGRTEDNVSDGPYTRSIAESSDNNEITITNLVQGYVYEFKISGRNGAGLGENASTVVTIPDSSGTDRVIDDGSSSIGTTTIAIITAGVVVGILLIMILVLAVTCIVKRKSKKSFNVYDSPIREVYAPPIRPREQRRSTMEIPLNSIGQDGAFSKTEDNEYEHMTFTVDEFPDLKKSLSNLEEVDGDGGDGDGDGNDGDGDGNGATGEGSSHQDETVATDELEIQSEEEPNEPANELSFL